MKKTVLFTFVALLLAIAIALSNLTQAKYRTGKLDISSLPSFDLLSLDSITAIHTQQINPGNPILLVYFSPDCDHCHRQISGILKKIAQLSTVRIYLFTPMPLSDLKVFVSYYRLDKYKNITVGWDNQYMFYKFYKATEFPCTVIYNSKKQLVKLYRSEVEAETIINSIRS